MRDSLQLHGEGRAVSTAFCNRVFHKGVRLCCGVIFITYVGGKGREGKERKGKGGERGGDPIRGTSKKVVINRVSSNCALSGWDHHV